VPREGQHQPARVLFGNKNGQSTLSRFSIRFLVSVARSAALSRAEHDVVKVPFRLRVSMKREQQKTPNDARRVEGRRDGKKSTARRREESERIF